MFIFIDQEIEILGNEEIILDFLAGIRVGVSYI